MSKPREVPKEKKIKIETAYEDDGKRFMLGIISKHPLHETDIIAGLDMVKDHVQNVLKRKLEAEAKKKESQLVGPDGKPVSSLDKPRIIQ